MKAQTARLKENRAMKKTAIAFALLATLHVCTAGAQTSGSESQTITSAPDLSKLSIEKILQQLQTTKPQSSSDETSPLEVVAAFLQLTPGQTGELGQLLQARQAKLVPLLQAAQTLTQQLGVLLNSGANPAQVGAVVIQIHTLQMQATQAQQAFLTQFAAILDSGQLQKLQAVQVAAQLQPILPAFQPIFLF